MLCRHKCSSSTRGSTPSRSTHNSVGYVKQANTTLKERPENVFFGTCNNRRGPHVRQLIPNIRPIQGTHSLNQQSKRCICMVVGLCTAIEWWGSKSVQRGPPDKPHGIQGYVQLSMPSMCQAIPKGAPFQSQPILDSPAPALENRSKAPSLRNCPLLMLQEHLRHPSKTLLAPPQPRVCRILAVQSDPIPTGCFPALPLSGMGPCAQTQGTCAG